jgi:FemAB-related protein (PEP-CTERM system-associated)
MDMATQTDVSPLTTKRLEPGDVESANAWDAFVLAHPQATFFHRAGWQTILLDVFRHETYFLYVERDGCITGILPLAHVKSWVFGNALVSLPFAVYGGVVASDAQTATALEYEASRIARRLGVDHLELRNMRPVHSDWPTQDIYVTFRKKMEPSNDANMQSIPRKQRAMVRKGAKNGLNSVLDGDVDRFYRLYTDNMRRHGTPALPRKYFQALRQEFGDDCEVLTVEGTDGRALSSVLSFYFRDEVLPYYAGDDVLARELAANDFKYWELMRRACARSAAVFDFGRSKTGTGSYAFKRNWGFEPTTLHYEYQLYKRSGIPQNNPSNSRFKPMIAVWRRMPLEVTNWLGPYIVRSLG